VAIRFAATHVRTERSWLKFDVVSVVTHQPDSRPPGPARDVELLLGSTGILKPSTALFQ
jgi:hypothetical protein